MERRQGPADASGSGHLVAPDWAVLIDHPIVEAAPDGLKEKDERLEIGNAMDHGVGIVEAGPEKLIDAPWRGMYL